MAILLTQPSYGPSGKATGSRSGVGAAGKGYYGFNSEQSWAPAVNLYETDRAYVVCVDLAGVDKDKTTVEVKGHHLQLKGMRAVPMFPEAECSGGTHSSGAETSRRCRVHVMEIDHGAFCRDVELPGDADRNAMSARYGDGLLWIEVPKRLG